MPRTAEEEKQFAEELAEAPQRRADEEGLTFAFTELCEQQEGFGLHYLWTELLDEASIDGMTRDINRIAEDQTLDTKARLRLINELVSNKADAYGIANVEHTSRSDELAGCRYTFKPAAAE